MDLPTLPTDNLYKFMALAGLVTLLVALVAFLSISNDLRLQIAETEGVVVSAEKERKRLEELEINLTKPIKDSYLQKRALHYLDLVEESRKKS